ncbi:MAG TPA: hypothetical protein DD791_05190 [Syntrophomonas sp.]|nr:hypothetical protein [Syntrophomonas sp.]
MNLKTKVLVVRIIIVVLALIVIGFVIATFDNPDIKIKLLNIGVMTCILLAVIHESLVRKN